MRRWVILAAAIAISPAPASAAFRCALSPERCAAVYVELRSYYSAAMRDEALFSNMPPYPRRLKVIERSSERLKRRVAVLPTDVASELSRLIWCDALDHALAAQGRDNLEKKCADQR